MSEFRPLAGWGRHPIRRGRVARAERLALPADGSRVAVRGLGRAYGDAALPAGEGDLVVDTTAADRIVSFDAATGRLRCEAGLSLGEVIRLFLPRGWFPPVTPGTKFVTVGGCVACDVHGKNHHRDGSFGCFVDEIRLLLGDGRTVDCGPARERELFLATVGGMGLTGLITEVAFRLAPVESPWIVLETEGVPSLDAMIEGLRAAGAEWPYTVGWIDCLARGGGLGRGVLMRGRHASRAEAADRPPRPRAALPVPVDAPEWLLSPRVVRLFNAIYYRVHGGRRRRRIVSYESFFYPLDALRDWNRLYGRRGFLQYQCVLPRTDRGGALTAVMDHLSRAGAASFLAVIKDCGPESDAYLSFPMEGMTLALDLPYRGPATEALIHELNALVAGAGGRVYLAKDGVTRAEDFARMTPRLGQWRAVRDRWDPEHRFRTALSIRLLGD